MTFGVYRIIYYPLFFLNNKLGEKILCISVQNDMTSKNQNNQPEHLEIKLLTDFILSTKWTIIGSYLP